VNTLKIFQYNDQPVSFRNEDGTVYVNATEMAKPFGKSPKDWLRTKASDVFITSLSVVRHISPTGLIIIKQGGNEQGTWMNEDVALEFSRWLAPAFAIWCNDRIKELMKYGVTAINPEDWLTPDNMIRAMQALKAERAEKELLQIRTDNQEQQLKIQAPKVEYHDTVLQSDGLIATTVIAQELGISAVALNRDLIRRKIIYGVNGTYALYVNYKERGYSSYKTHYHTDAQGRTVSTQHLYWTQAGRKFILELVSQARRSA